MDGMEIHATKEIVQTLYALQILILLKFNNALTVVKMEDVILISNNVNVQIMMAIQLAIMDKIVLYKVV